jgi:two-component system NarL family sensor kinase
VKRLASPSPVVQFAASGLAATLIIGAIGVAVTRHIGIDTAIGDAERVTMLVGQGIVGPNLTPAVLAGEPAARRRLDRIVRTRVLRQGIVRVKVWSPDGRVLYSDDPRIIGRQFNLRGGALFALGRELTAGGVTDLSGLENQFERASHRVNRDGRDLLEVYTPIRARDGRRLIFEAYQRSASVSATGRDVWLAFAPALLGGLLLLQLVNLPLARSLAGRLRRGQNEREALLQRALDASETERRVIAADLHDGIVQDLVGVSYELSAEAQAREGRGDAGAAAAIERSAAKTRAGVRSLRALLLDIYPPNLHRAGVAQALHDLAAAQTARGLATRVTMPDDLSLGEPAERLLFRFAQEALRNSRRHADATSAEIRVERRGDRLVMEVCDDGRGFDPATLDEQRLDGGFGLRALSDLVQDAGGHLDVASAAGAGTTVRMDIAV